MDSLRLNQKQKNIFSFFSLGIIILALFFNFRALLGRIAYRQAFGYLRPASLVGRKEYYRDKLSAIEKAVSFVPDEARYYSYYASVIDSILSDNLDESLGVDKKKTESLHTKAIKLNPTNFLHHVSLGRFYRKQQDERAEKKLFEAINLYPTYTGKAISRELAYLHGERAKDYLEDGKTLEAFKNIALSIYYKRGQRQHHEYIETKAFMKSMFDGVELVPGLELNTEKINLKITVNPLSSDYDFGAEGFPSLQVELSFRVYLDNRDDQVFLYKRFRPYGHFEYVAEEGGFFVYEYVLRDYPEGAYLDDFRIQTENYSLLEKVEIIKSFRR